MLDRTSPIVTAVTITLCLLRRHDDGEEEPLRASSTLPSPSRSFKLFVTLLGLVDMVFPASFVVVVAGLSAIVAVRGDAIPIAPGPGAVFNQGSKCSTSWVGDKDGKWANMKIQLMTGDNFQMIELATVATGLDGNKDGTFEFDCPAVNPYSAVYFFQYTAPGGSGPQWATRFAIADKDGKTVPPPESIQPNGAAIPWGIGKLAGSDSTSTSATTIITTTSQSSTTSSSTSTTSVTVSTSSSRDTVSVSTSTTSTLTTSSSTTVTASSISTTSTGITTSITRGGTLTVGNGYRTGDSTLVTVRPSSSKASLVTQTANTSNNTNGASPPVSVGSVSVTIISIFSIFALHM
ncbi:hypothetical protein PM082_011482 [Marasmius tenuissimus]|nr:hypothetical protein PM082_011482 [Marasmius tenuissimus]